MPGTPPGSYRVEVTAYGVHDERDLPPTQGRRALLGPIEIPKQANVSVENLDIQHPLGIELGGRLSLLGYDVKSGFRPGDGVYLVLYWQALSKMSEDYTVFAHLIDAGGTFRGQEDNPPADGFYPTSAWEPGEIVRDPHVIPIDAQAPVGDYRIEVGAYLAGTGARLPVSNAAPGAAPDRVDLSPFHVDVKGAQP